MTSYGYTKNLYVLPFDHRASFSEKLLGYKGTLTDAQKNNVTAYKRIIYDAIGEAIKEGLPKENGAVLVDEIFGEEILRDAKGEGIVTMQTVEKSGQDEFVCEYGEDFGAHLLAIKPTFAKVLIRYNPSGDVIMNSRQRMRLKQVSDFVRAHDIKLLLEPLVPASKVDAELLDGDEKNYDDDLRPAHTIEMMREIQREGIEVDVWKIEGMNDTENYKKVVEVARNTPERYDVGVIILGRNETKENVIRWITAGKNVEGVIGFAVGRTIFWGPLEKYRDKKISREEAVKRDRGRILRNVSSIHFMIMSKNWSKLVFFIVALFWGASYAFQKPLLLSISPVTFTFGIFLFLVQCF